MRTQGGAWHLTGFCLQMLLRGSIFCLSLQLRRFWQAAHLPSGPGGWAEMGAWKAALKGGFSQLLGCEPLDHLILERKERKECFAGFGHTPYVVTCERKQQPTHFNTCMPLETFMTLWPKPWYWVSEASVYFCSSGKNWKDRVSWSCQWERARPTKSRMHKKLVVSSEEPELLSSSCAFLISSTNTVNQHLL